MINMSMNVVKNAFKDIKDCETEINKLKKEISVWEDGKKEAFTMLLQDLKVDVKSDEGKMVVAELKKALEMYLVEAKKKQLHIMMGAKGILESVEGVDYD